MMQEAGISLTELDAVSVCEGPGSYTGLRVGMASAKGICYALRKPLIVISSLSVMGYVARQDIKKTAGNDDYWIVPMIDARRNEVFTAVLDQHLNIIMPPQAMILQPNSFAELEGKSVLFTGNGSPKWQSQCSLSQAVFLPLEWDAAGIVPLSELNYSQAQFASVASGKLSCAHKGHPYAVDWTGTNARLPYLLLSPTFSLTWRGWHRVPMQV
jgi:tRNA threonylcarbamoyladenosine biosynthesis protein TsaB